VRLPYIPFCSRSPCDLFLVYWKVYKWCLVTCFWGIVDENCCTNAIWASSKCVFILDNLHQSSFWLPKFLFQLDNLVYLKSSSICSLEWRILSSFAKIPRLWIYQKLHTFKIDWTCIHLAWNNGFIYRYLYFGTSLFLLYKSLLKALKKCLSLDFS